MLAKLLFRPLGMFVGLFVARKVGNRAFEGTWERRYGTQAPTPTTQQASWPQVVGAAALKGSILAVSVAFFHRSAAKAFHHLTGFWPGEDEPPPAARLEPKRRG